jgi:hypothetical protein
MDDIWRAAQAGDLGEVERLVGQDPGLLNAKDHGMTPLMHASGRGHVGVVQWLLDQGAAVNKRGYDGMTALLCACDGGRAAVAMLLMEKGADPTITDDHGSTPLTTASEEGSLEVVRSLLRLPSAKAAINHRDHSGETALHMASFMGHAGVVRALLESGADPTIADIKGTTPMAAAKQELRPEERDPDDEDDDEALAERKRECVEALEVRFLSVSLHHSSTCFSDQLAERWGLFPWARWQEAELAYQLWKARQVADKQGSGAVAVGGEEGEEEEAGKALVDFAIHGLKGDLFRDLMEMMW